MISHDELHTLIHHQPQEGRKVLSVYLNVDQGRASNLNREFEVPLRNMLREIENGIGDAYEREEFRDCAARVKQYVESYRPAGRTLVLFAEPAAGLFWARGLRTAIENQARWLHRPFVRPFLEAREKHPRYAVVLTDRGKARIVSVCMGEIEHETALEAQEDVRHFDASGKDQMGSQMRFQRSAQEHAKHHLKNVANKVKELHGKQPFDRLILAGTSRTLAELERLLPEPLKQRVACTASLPVEASRKAVLAEVARVDERFERENEMTLTEELLTAAAKNGLATTGVEDTVKATVEGRVRTLVYPRGLHVPAKTCTAVPTNGGAAVRLTDYLGEGIEPEQNLLDLLVENAAREGGTVEVLHGEAGSRLKESGAGIGAFLRY